MKNKRRCSINYILVKNVRSSGNNIIHRWISMLLTGICAATAGTATSSVGGAGFASEQKEGGMTSSMEKQILLECSFSVSELALT